jgi:hypothetical protein
MLVSRLIRPKSFTLTTERSGETRTSRGVRLRWITPFWCAWASPRQIARMTENASGMVSRRWRSILSSEVPSKNSRTR